MRKTLLQIKAVGNHGGGGMGEYIGRAAMRSGWDSYVAFARNILPSQNKFIKIGNGISIKEHVLESRLFDNSGFASRLATTQFLKRIDKINPSIIHLHNLHGYYINVELLFEYLNQKKIPVVWTMHDCWPFTGHCAHFVSIGCEKWKNRCHDCVLRSAYPKSWFLDMSSRNFEKKKKIFLSIENLHIVTVSRWLENKVRESFFYGKDIRTIYNGIDTNVFAPQLTDHDRNFLILGVAYTWSKDKGFDDYLKLSKMLKDDERIILIGIKDEIVQKLPHNIIGIGRTNSQTELAEFYSKADIVTSLSYAETFGMTVAEANACGTPAIVYDNTAQPELIRPETGFVVETGNVDAVYKCICNMREMKKADIDKMRTSCRINAEKNYRDLDLYNEYIDLYESLI